MILRYDPVGPQVGKKLRVVLTVNGIREMLYEGYLSKWGYTITLYPDHRFLGGSGGIPVRCKKKHEIAVGDLGKEIEYGQRD